MKNTETEKQLPREERVNQIFKETKTVIKDSHVVYTSGEHGSDYVNKDAIYPHPKEICELCGMFAEDFKDKNIEVVAGPAIGGVILEALTAQHLTRVTGKEVSGVYAEKQADEEKSFAFERGNAAFIKGKRVLIVEDILTTGGSAKKVIDAVRKLGGEVVGLGVLCNRGGVKPEDVGGVEIDALINVKMDRYKPDACPLCNAGVPINTNVGKGKEYLAQKKL